MNDLNQPQASFLITRMLDELVALIISVWEAEKEGVDGLNVSYEGESPIEKLAFMEQNFDPYNHVNIKDHMVNMGSYLSELFRVFTLDGTAEYNLLMDYLKKNVDNIHYMGSVIYRIEENMKRESEKNNDFY